MAKATTSRPRRHISQKVPKSGGPTPADAIMLALNMAEDLMHQYQGWAVDDLEKLWRKFLEVGADKSASDLHLAEMFDIAHEIRGQGGTFGFPLISVVGDSLCKFLDGRKSLGAVELDIIKVHIMAMKAVFRQELKGDQGDLNKELPLLLVALREKVENKVARG